MRLFLIIFNHSVEGEESELTPDVQRPLVQQEN